MYFLGLISHTSRHFKEMLVFVSGVLFVFFVAKGEKDGEGRPPPPPPLFGDLPAIQP